MALIALTAAAILVIAAGLMRAVRNVDTRVPRIPRPGQPKLVKWQVRLPRLRRYRTRNVVDRTAEVLRQAIFHVLDILLITIVAGTRIATNCLLIATYVMKRFLVAVTNLLLKIVILTTRWLAIALASIAGLSYRAFSTAVTACLFTLVSVGLPLCTLAGAAWLVTASAEQTRRYLLAGPLIELRNLVGLISLAVALLTITWIMLAGQRLRDSLRSAERTLPYAIAYGVILTATGGWLLGGFEKIGYGKIHYGDVTFASTGLTFAAVATMWLWNRIRHDAGENRADRKKAGPIPPPRYSSAGFGNPPRHRGSRPGSYSDPAWSRPSQAPDNVKRWFVLTLVVLATLALSVWVGPDLVSASGHSLASSQHAAVKANPSSHRAHGRATPQTTTPASAVHPPAPESTGARTTSFRVPADTQGGVNTGIYAVQGDTIVITGRGSAGYGYEGSQGCVGSPTTHPGGSRYVGSFNCGPKDDQNAVLSGAAIGLLIARIGGGTWFGVGNGTTFIAGGNGYIHLAYNDSVYSDNTGSYSATVTYNGAGPVTSPSVKPRASQSSPAWTSPSSFPITYPKDMTIACGQKFGPDSYAHWTDTSPPSYGIVCVNDGSDYTGLDLVTFCPWLAHHDHHRSPNGPDGWWSGNPERYDPNTSDHPWLHWRCYNNENRP